MIKYFTGELASKLIGKEDDTIVIAYANQIADDKLAIKIRDKVNNTHGPTQPRMPPISIGGGIGEQRGENKRILFTLN